MVVHAHREDLARDLTGKRRLDSQGHFDGGCGDQEKNLAWGEPHWEYTRW